MAAYSSTLHAAVTNDNASLSGTGAVPFATANDLHITAGAPEFNVGATIASVVQDIDGDSRPQGPAYDIGADEVAVSYTLTYTAGPNGMISGTSPQTVPMGGSGTPVTAVPDAGYHFVNWSDASTQNPRTDTNVMANVSVTANFAINTYTLTYTAGANGSIVGTSPQTVNYGANGTLVTATPDTGYHFVSWSDGYPTAARTDMNVMADVTATATFAINTYTLTYTAGANGSIVGTSPQMVNHGANGTLVTATPVAGYHFVSWSDGYPTAARTDMNVTADITATATFAINTYTLTYTAGANGTISGTSPQTVNHGANGSPVTAVPDSGYHFVSWSDGYPTAARTDMNVMADVNATATFALDTFTVTYDGNTNTGGTAPVDPNSPYAANALVTVLNQGTLVKAGSNFTGWNTLANGTGTAYAPGNTFNITANTTLFAQWTLIPTCVKTVLPNDNSTSGNARAPSTRFAASRSVYLIKATELAAAGYTTGSVPTSIGWNYQAGGTAGSAPLMIYMQNTADTTIPQEHDLATAIAGMTTVHNATTALPAAAGPFDITFSGGSPFTYTGGGLYVAFDWGQYAGTLGRRYRHLVQQHGPCKRPGGRQSNRLAPRPRLPATSVPRHA